MATLESRPVPQDPAATPPHAAARPAPSKTGGTGLVLAYVAAFFALYVALLTPVISTLALRVIALSTPETRAAEPRRRAVVGPALRRRPT